MSKLTIMLSVCLAISVVLNIWQNLPNNISTKIPKNIKAHNKDTVNLQEGEPDVTMIPKNNYGITETKMEIEVKIKNISNENVYFFGSDYFRLVLYSEQGIPIEKKASEIEYEKTIHDEPGSIYPILKPGEEYQNTIDLKDWFVIKNPGKYYLLGLFHEGNSMPFEPINPVLINIMK